MILEPVMWPDNRSRAMCNRMGAKQNGRVGIGIGVPALGRKNDLPYKCSRLSIRTGTRGSLVGAIRLAYHPPFEFLTYC